MQDAMTIEWSPDYVPYPKVSNGTNLRQIADYILSLLQKKHPVHELTYGSPLNNAYIKIAQILKRDTTEPAPTQT